jgi:pyrroloquinoline quinone (PQQ) biosynthesis protein C
MNNSSIESHERAGENRFGRHVEMWLAIACALGLFGLALGWTLYGGP